MRTIEEQIKGKLTDLVDEHFPKGDKARGRAMVIMSLLYIFVEKLTIPRDGTKWS